MRPSRSHRAFATSLILTACANSATALPTVRPSHVADHNTAIQLAKTQCYWKEVCLRWLRPHPAGTPPKCFKWENRRTCEPHVYNDPNKPSSTLGRVHVPKLIAKPKPWQFQQRSTLPMRPSFTTPHRTMIR